MHQNDFFHKFCSDAYYGFHQFFHLLFLSEIFKLLTMRSRRAHAAEAPDANEDETTNLIIGPAFARIIREVGFPNKVTSIDAAFLLLGILSRPTACKENVLYE